MGCLFEILKGYESLKKESLMIVVWGAIWRSRLDSYLGIIFTLGRQLSMHPWTCVSCFSSFHVPQLLAISRPVFLAARFIELEVAGLWASRWFVEL